MREERKAEGDAPRASAEPWPRGASRVRRKRDRVSLLPLRSLCPWQRFEASAPRHLSRALCSRVSVALGCGLRALRSSMTR